MPTYLLKKFDGSGQLKGHGEIDGPDDDDVVAWAVKLPHSYGYEIWCADRLVYQTATPQAERRPPDNG
jgi:hypothetical protein